jgi:hypothetical protein
MWPEVERRSPDRARNVTRIAPSARDAARDPTTAAARVADARPPRAVGD